MAYFGIHRVPQITTTGKAGSFLFWKNRKTTTQKVTRA